MGLIEALVPCLTVIARVPQTQAGKAEGIGASFLGAPAPGWFGPVMLVGPSGGLADDGASGWPVIGWGASHFRRPRCWRKWFQSTRLETRTKESNMCASIAGGKNPIKMRSESKRRWESLKPEAPSTDLEYFIMIDLSMSIFVGTRKMVNYA